MGSGHTFTLLAMITTCLSVSLLYCDQAFCEEQDTPLGISRSIDEMIECKNGSPHEQQMLIDFRSGFTSSDRVKVTEFKDYFELMVTHPGSEPVSGGAECYRIEKSTGNIRMIWHEHPQESSVLIDE